MMSTPIETPISCHAMQCKETPTNMSKPTKTVNKPHVYFNDDMQSSFLLLAASHSSRYFQCSWKVLCLLLEIYERIRTRAWSHLIFMQSSFLLLENYKRIRNWSVVSSQRISNREVFPPATPPCSPSLSSSKRKQTHMEQRDNTIESLLTQVEELHLSQKEEMIGIKARIKNLGILSRKQCMGQLKVCAGEVLKWSVKMQGTKRQDAMQFFNRAVAAEVMVSIFTMTISFVFLTFL